MSNQQITTATMRDPAGDRDISSPKAGGRSDEDLDTLLETSVNYEDVLLAFKHKGILWDDVLESIHDAKEQYHTKSEKNKLQNVYRNKALIMTLHSLTDMIPDQNGLSVMRGGLKLIFKVRKYFLIPAKDHRPG